MKKDYLEVWSEQKKEISEKEVTLSAFPKEGEVWMVVFGENIGFEQNGSGEKFIRPGLVIKRFNNQMFWVVPLSTKQKSFDFYFNFTDLDNNNVSVILAQMRLVSVKRFIRDMYIMESELFGKLLKSLHLLIPHK